MDRVQSVEFLKKTRRFVLTQKTHFTPMKIRTQKGIDQLNLKIQTELGVDVQKYRNEEVAESFVSLLVFPQYVINWTIRPILIAFLLYIIGFFVVDLVTNRVLYFYFSIKNLILPASIKKIIHNDSRSYSKTTCHNYP